MKIVSFIVLKNVFIYICYLDKKEGVHLLFTSPSQLNETHCVSLIFAHHPIALCWMWFLAQWKSNLLNASKCAMIVRYDGEHCFTHQYPSYSAHTRKCRTAGQILWSIDVYICVGVFVCALQIIYPLFAFNEGPDRYLN